MKKLLLLFLILLNLAIAAALIAVLLYALNGGDPFSEIKKYVGGSIAMYNSEELLETSSIHLEDELNIDCSYYDLTIRVVDAGEATLRRYGLSNIHGDDTLTISNSNARTDISLKTSGRLIVFNVSFVSPRLELDIPRSWHGVLNGTGSSGVIRLEDDLNCKAVSLSCSSGKLLTEGKINADDSIRLKTSSGKAFASGTLSAGGAVAMSSSSGSVTVTDISTAASVDLKASSGSIKSTGTINASESLTAAVNSGSIKLGSVTAARYDFTCTSGRAEVLSLSGAGTAKTSSGSLVLYLEPGSVLEADCTSGSIKAYVPHDVVYSLDASKTSGSIRSAQPLRSLGDRREVTADDSGASIHITASCSSGSVRVDYR